MHLKCVVGGLIGVGSGILQSITVFFHFPLLLYLISYLYDTQQWGGCGMPSGSWKKEGPEVFCMCRYIGTALLFSLLPLKILEIITFNTCPFSLLLYTSDEWTFSTLRELFPNLSHS